MIDGNQTALDLDLGPDTPPLPGKGTAEEPIPVSSERAGFLRDAIRGAFTSLGLDAVSSHDGVFYDLVTARVIHPGSKYESVETLAEVGVSSASYSTIKRHLPIYATPKFRDEITRALATRAGIGPGVLVLYDVTTLYFETDIEDELRRPGFSKERRLEPQITVGMLTDHTGFPLSVGAFDGNRAETQTMLPMIRRLAEAYRLDDITVVADAGMFSASNKQAVVDAGLNYILGVKTPDIPYPIAQWRQDHPDREYEDGQIWSLADRCGLGLTGCPGR